MEQEKLIALLQDMSLEEKINQLFQVHGNFFEGDSIATGPAAAQGFSEKAIREAGSVLGSTGASLLKRIQDKQMEQQPHHIPLLCYGTLSGGFLSERWMGKTLAEPETRSQVKYLQVIEDSLGWEGYQKLLLMLKEIADRHEVSISNVATKYILSQEGVGAAIVGVRNSRHVKSNAQIFEFTLEPEEIERIRSFLSPFGTVEGEPFEQERTIGSKYRNIMWMNLNEE